MSTGNGSISGSQYAKAISIKKTSSAGWMPASIEAKYIDAKKEKKMGWFKRKFAQWSREAWENSRMDAPVEAVKTPEAKSSIRFTVYPANGGYVIEHYKQDRYRDGEGPTLTIVNNGDSMGTAVEHILALEALKA